MNGFTSDEEDDPSTMFISSIQADIIALIEQRMLEQGLEASNFENAGYKKTISEKGLESINRQIYNSSQHTSCGVKCLISQEEFQHDESMIGILPCGHYFDYEQLDLWLREKPECPLCRYEMDAEEVKIRASGTGPSGTGASGTGPSGTGPMDRMGTHTDISGIHNTITNTLNSFPTSSNLLNHMLLLGQLENN
tara:strand:+ start:1002 stop:1583 length:582 start_codon:yes stop_codon:yes gene_type:complete